MDIEQFTHRLKLLEQKLDIMQREMGEVLGEMHTAVQMVMRGSENGMLALSQRVDILENQREVIETRSEGKEL